MSDISTSSGEKNSLRKIVIFGAGGHAVSSANVALSAGYKIINFVDSQRSGSSLLGYRVIGSILELENIRDLSFAIAIGDNFAREKFYEEITNMMPGLVFPVLVHQSAIISSFSKIGEGTIVMPNAVVGPNSKVGKFCILNTNSSIDHDSTMLDYSSLAPAAVTGGRVSIGARSAISIGAVLKNGIEIGGDCVVGAKSYLNKDLPPNQMAYGTPAKIVRTRKIGEAYL